ncbi:hypothetical protein ACWG8W_06085 [Citricoccus zhacaiensis]
MSATLNHSPFATLADVEALEELPRTRKVVMCAATDPDADALEYWAREGDEGLQLMIARNAHAPVNVLDILAEEGKPLSVRLAVAENPAIDINVLSVLTGSDTLEAEIKLAVINSGKAPLGYLQGVALGADEDLAFAAEAAIEKLEAEAGR